MILLSQTFNNKITYFSGFGNLYINVCQLFKFGICMTPLLFQMSIHICTWLCIFIVNFFLRMSYLPQIVKTSVLTKPRSTCTNPCTVKVGTLSPNEGGHVLIISQDFCKTTSLPEANTQVLVAPESRVDSLLVNPYPKGMTFLGSKLSRWWSPLRLSNLDGYWTSLFHLTSSKSCCSFGKFSGSTGQQSGCLWCSADPPGWHHW